MSSPTPKHPIHFQRNLTKQHSKVLILQISKLTIQHEGLLIFLKQDKSTVSGRQKCLINTKITFIVILAGLGVCRLCKMKHMNKKLEIIHSFLQPISQSC